MSNFDKAAIEAINTLRNINDDLDNIGLNIGKGSYFHNNYGQ